MTNNIRRLNRFKRVILATLVLAGIFVSGAIDLL